MTSRVRYKRNAELPSLEIWWLDDDGVLVDMSAASAFELKIGNVGSAAVLTKTTGVTGAAGSGTETNGTPNVTVAWSAGELNLTPGPYTMQLSATFAQGQRVLDCSFVVEDTIT
jgi:hypothetical protein